MDPMMDSEPTPTETNAPSDRVAEAVAPVTELLETAQKELAHQVEIRPYVTILAAAALGYVLGGGVPVWAGRAAVTIGSRMLMARVVSALVDDDR